TSLTYLGSGKLLLAAGEGSIWFSSDYGETWGNRTAMPKTRGGVAFNLWDSFMADRQGADRVLAGGYTMDMTRYHGAAAAGYSNGAIRISQDKGHTWGDLIKPSEWTGVSEIALIRAGNGNLVAACRTDWPKRFRKQNFDHYEGIAVSISRNNGATWSKLNRLYAWGRHHPSLVLLQNGDIVMSYVVRKGYPDTAEGYPQFGIEAIVSRDHGETWDLDHRYILAAWPGIATGPNAWYASSQATSTVLLPGGSLLTAFGTGYRSRDPAGIGKPGPRDVGLVLWSSHRPVDTDRTISNAHYDSDLRNNFDPFAGKTKVAPFCAAARGKKNIAVLEEGAQASASANDGVPAYLLRNRYSRPVLTLETLPAWAELRWPNAHRIAEVHIQPGAPEHARRPGTECVPLDYRLQYSKDGHWVDVVPPVTNAKRYKDFDPRLRAYLIEDSEFEYVHRFPAVSTNAIRMYITRSSGSADTALRAIEVFEAAP
ncbi:MAG: sialidase family protein, partial [Bryobacteraceae bacterium]